MQIFSTTESGPDTIRARINPREAALLESRMRLKGRVPFQDSQTGEWHFDDGDNGGEAGSSGDEGAPSGDDGGWSNYGPDQNADGSDQGWNSSFGDDSLSNLAEQSQYNPSAMADYQSALAAYSSVDLSNAGISATLSQVAEENAAGYGVTTGEISVVGTVGAIDDAVYSNEGRNAGVSALSARNAEYNEALSEAQENLAAAKTGILGYVINQTINVVSGIVGTSVGTVTGTGPLGGALGAKGTNAALNAGLEAAITGVSLSGYGNNTGISNTAFTNDIGQVDTVSNNTSTYSVADDNGMTTNDGGDTGDNSTGNLGATTMFNSTSLPIPKTFAEAQAYGALSGNNAAGQESYERLIGMPDDGDLDGYFEGKLVYDFTGDEIAAIRAREKTVTTIASTANNTSGGYDELLLGLLVAAATIL